MPETILITGGAGFIGRTVTKELLARGNTVRVFDSLIEQVHGDRELPEDFPDDAELIRGDIRNMSRGRLRMHWFTRMRWGRCSTSAREPTAASGRSRDRLRGL